MASSRVVTQPTPLLAFTLFLVCFAATSFSRPLPLSQFDLQPEGLLGHFTATAGDGMDQSLEDTTFIDRKLPGSSSGGSAVVVERDVLTSGELMDEAIESAAASEKDPGSVEVRETDKVVDNDQVGATTAPEMYAVAKPAPLSETTDAVSDAAADGATASRAEPSEYDDMQFDDSGSMATVAPELQLKVLKRTAAMLMRQMAGGVWSDSAAEAEREGGSGASEVDSSRPDAVTTPVVGEESDAEVSGSDSGVSVAPKLQAKVMRDAVLKMERRYLDATSASSE